MYPALTSFYNVPVVLTRFIEINGWPAWGQNYPYWYLGTTPLRYLIGPVVPGLMIWGQQLWPQLNLFEILMGLSLGFWIFGMIGVYVWRKNIWISLFYGFGLIMPWIWPVSDGTYLMAFSLLPWVLAFRHRRVLLSISIAFVILTNSLMVPTLVLALIISWLSGKKSVKSLKMTAWCLLAGLLMATIWYTPGYWWQLLQAPSFGGKTLWVVMGQLIKLLPLGVGLMVVRVKSGRLGWYWLATFGWLSLLRLIADPDFWLDWVAYGLEIQLGLAILLGSRKRFRYVLMGLLFLGWVMLVEKRVVAKLRPTVTDSVEFKLGEGLSRLVKPGETVFLSGSVGFWLNSWFDIRQVRGGVDQASVDPDWRGLAWEVREGKDGQKATNELQKAGVSWLVVHNQESSEIYHDFKDPEKFEKVKELEKVYEQNGDIIYKL